MKVGDFVRVEMLLGADERNGLRVGTVGTVVQADWDVAGTKCIVAFDSFVPNTRIHVVESGYLMLNSQLVVIPESNKLKVGDRVKIVKNFMGRERTGRVLRLDWPEPGRTFVEIDTLDIVRGAWHFSTASLERIDTSSSQSKTHSAKTTLQAASAVIQERADQRDQPDGERSMGRIVAAFNGATGHSLTEEQGWAFMVLLKAVRALSGGHNNDDYVDGAAYFALMGEVK